VTGDIGEADSATPPAETPTHTRDFGTCNFCGHPAEKFQSGIPTCWRCWYLRKMDFPAAEHWAKTAALFLSNVDTYDFLSYFSACGLTKDEAMQMLLNAKKVLEHSRSVLEKGYERD
jgi:hypothetical protein